MERVNHKISEQRPECLTKWAPRIALRKKKGGRKNSEKFLGTKMKRSGGLRRGGDVGSSRTRGSRGIQKRGARERGIPTWNEAGPPTGARYAAGYGGEGEPGGGGFGGGGGGGFTRHEYSKKRGGAQREGHLQVSPLKETYHEKYREECLRSERSRDVFLR